DIFTAQDMISEKVASVLALQLNGEERRLLSKRYTENLEAYQLYLKGRYHLDKRAGSETRKSMGYFEQVTKVDPAYALAYAGLAEAYVSLSLLESDVADGETLDRANAAAARAVELDDDLAEAHAALAFAQWNDVQEGFRPYLVDKEFRRAIELNPNLVLAHRWYAIFLTDDLRFDEAISEMKRALEIDALAAIN